MLLKKSKKQNMFAGTRVKEVIKVTCATSPYFEYSYSLSNRANGNILVAQSRHVNTLLTNYFTNFPSIPSIVSSHIF